MIEGKADEISSAFSFLIDTYNWAMLDFEPNENLGLVEFHGLWNGVISVWLRWWECPGGTGNSGGKSVGGELADHWADADL